MAKFPLYALSGYNKALGIFYKLFVAGKAMGINMENHTHKHTHEHLHVSAEENLALLEYMVGHNAHHAEELHKIAHNAEGEARTLIHEAVALMNEGNEKLSKALKLMKGE